MVEDPFGSFRKRGSEIEIAFAAISQAAIAAEAVSR
jgi:hypothetical protein